MNCLDLDSKIVDICLENEEDGNTIIKITPHNDISNESLIDILKKVYDYENNKDDNTELLLNLKSLNAESLAEAFKYALTRDDIKDPITILNIINLIKIYNTLDDSFFNCEHIWFSSLENMLDVKLLIHAELKQFIRQFSIYFLSLIKSYNKVTYTPMDNNIDLPQIYKTLFLSIDFMTAAGIFSMSKSINTDELFFINDHMGYLTDMMMKTCNSMNILDAFLNETKNID